MTVTRDTKLVRAAELSLRLHANGEVTWSSTSGTLRLGPRALELLLAFEHPRAFGEGLDAFVMRGERDFVEATSTALSLVRLGLLREEGAPTFAESTSPWEAATTHVAMLGDLRRTTSFVEALRDTVRPDDVVLDVGTGTGVLAVAAAKAGAAHVYAIEASRLANIAEAMAQANGVADRVTVVRGWSTRIDLPRRATVLVSETIGDDPLEERILEISADARRRLLTADARLIPSSLGLYAAPVEVPENLLQLLTVTPESAMRWKAATGIDFQTLVTADAGHLRSATLTPSEAKRCRMLGPSSHLLDVIPGQRAPTSSGTAAAHVTDTGTLHGLLLLFEARLTDSIRLTSDPRHTDVNHHWRTPLWLQPTPRMVTPGDILTLRWSSGAGTTRVEVT
jgi:hypothetical protein